MVEYITGTLNFLKIRVLHIECYSTQWVVHASWYDSMEGIVCRLEEC
jgi:hypothetical protein